MITNTRHNPLPVQTPYQGIYAHGVEVKTPARQLHISGQVGLNHQGQLAEGFKAQCEQAFCNVQSVLQSAAMNLRDIVKMQFYLTDRQHIAELVEVRKAMLDGTSPAITTFIVAELVDKDWLVEVDVFASRSHLESQIGQLW